MADDLFRQWALLRMVPRAPRRMDAAELAARLVSGGYASNRRMVQRDLHRLSQIFPLEHHDEHRPHGWCWSRDANPFDTLGMDAAAAVAVQLMDLHLARLLPGVLRDAIAPSVALSGRVLAELGAHPGAGFVSKVRLVSDRVVLAPPAVDADVLDAVTTALYRDRQLRVRYVRRNETEPRSYTLSPVGLVARGAVLLLAASAGPGDIVKSYLLHRMLEAQPLDEPATPPEGFDLDAWIASGALAVRQGGAPLQIRARFAPLWAAELRETPPGQVSEMVAEADGSLVATVTLPDTAGVRIWLRSLGAGVEVLAPASLRAELAAEAQRLAAIYGGG